MLMISWNQLICFSKWIVAVIFIGAALAVQPMCFAGGTGPVPSLILNEDNSHFFGSRSSNEMTLSGLHAFIDQYANTAVSHLFLCPNSMKASYRSGVWDAIWEFKEGQKAPQEEFARKWCENARLLEERGLDPYAVWIARCREKKISPWLSVRMNDVHNADEVDNYIHSSFWRSHPEYWRVPGGRSWTDRALDFGIQEVRKHAMALIQELLERYDPDGIELDWMRFGYHFRPGKEAEGAVLLNQFMRDVRKLTQQWSEKRGHVIKVAARVPTHPDAAIGLGMDGVTWARENMIDLLIPTPFWATTDFDVPIELWNKRIGKASNKLIIAAGAEILLRAHPAAKPVESDITAIRGFAAACLHRGADCIYLFNYMDPAPMVGGKEAYRLLLSEGLNQNGVFKNSRRHVVTYRDTVASGMSANAQLPLKGHKGGTIRIYNGLAARGAEALIIAGLSSSEGMAGAAFEARINGKRCMPKSDLAEPSIFPGIARAIQFQCPKGSIRRGYSTIEIRQLAGQTEQKIEWLELRIEPRYSD